jgi:hypothetical protein
MEPILPTSHGMGLLSHEERVEEKSLPDELTESEQQIPPSRYPNKKDYDNKMQSVNAKIEEIDLHINNQPVSNPAAKSVVEWNETLNNGKPIDWDYWLELDNIKPEQAAKLAHNIDPRLWPDDRYAAGKPYSLYPNGDKIDKELSIEIESLKQLLDNHSKKQQRDNHSKEWSLGNLISFLGEEKAPFGMLEAVKTLVIPEPQAEDSEWETEVVGSSGAVSHINSIYKPDPDLTKLENQRNAILTVIEQKQFNPMEIPDGEKGTIKLICEADYPRLFDGDTSFDNAWKKGRELFRMANHASYAKRGSN